MMEVRFFSTVWLGADKEDTDRGWWTLRDTGAMAAKLRGQWHTKTDKKMDYNPSHHGSLGRQFSVIFNERHFPLCPEATAARSTQILRDLGMAGRRHVWGPAECHKYENSPKIPKWEWHPWWQHAVIAGKIPRRKYSLHNCKI